MISRETYFKVTKTNPVIPPLVFGPIAIGLFSWVVFQQTLAWPSILSLILAGIVCWTLVEYFLHRFSFHFQTKNETLAMFTSTAHLEHHAFPNQPDYVIAPIIYAVPMYALELYFFRFLTGRWDVALLLGVGIILGYLYYEWVHFMSHQKPARNIFTKFLKKYHLIHHFHDSDNYFGVTSPFWDYVFGTKPKTGEVTDPRILPIVSRVRSS